MNCSGEGGKPTFLKFDELGHCALNCSAEGGKPTFLKFDELGHCAVVTSVFTRSPPLPEKKGCSSANLHSPVCEVVKKKRVVMYKRERGTICPFGVFSPVLQFFLMVA